MFCQSLLAVVPPYSQVGPALETNSLVVLPQAWVSPYQCLHMIPPYGQDVDSIASFSRRLASPSLPPCCNNKQERPEAPFTKVEIPSLRKEFCVQEQWHGYLQQQCTHLWSLWAPGSVYLHWGVGKVTTFALHLSDMQRLANICSSTRL